MQETRICQNCKKEFIIEPEDFEFYKRIDVPPPTWCPECRMIRRMVWRNERALYKRKCDLCGKDIIGMYPKSSDFTVYCTNCWFSDGWNPLGFGISYNFSESFFKQFASLFKKNPQPSVESYNNKYCEYANYTWFSKNIYYSFSSIYSSDVFYSYTSWETNNSLDSLIINKSAFSYYLINSYECNKCKYLLNCKECLDSSFLFNCKNCQNCFMSSNLRNKSFVFKNIQLTPKEYKKELSKIKFSSYVVLNNLFEEWKYLIKNSIHKFGDLKNTINCYGHELVNSKDCIYCFAGEKLENVKYGHKMLSIKDSYDLLGAGDGGELLYEGMNIGYKDYYNLFSVHTYDNTNNIKYSYFCRNSSHLFGCVGLRNKQYCILNKQYTKDEYFKMVEKIKQHMNDMPYIDSQGRVYRYGEFFPPELSPFAYNETIAQEYFPKTKEEALAQGYRWKDREERNIKPDLYTKDLPDHIKDVDNSIIGKIIQCAHSKINPDGTLEEGCNQMCTTAFKIIEPELEFYKRMNLPLPRLCPNCRHFERLKLRNPLKLWKRKCQCLGATGQNPNNPNTYQNQTTHFHGNTSCPNEFQTSYSPDRPEIIYCEECYNSEVV